MKTSDKDNTQKEYDFSKDVRGRYYQRSNVIVLEPDRQMHPIILRQSIRR
jgi:hypothetical protein